MQLSEVYDQEGSECECECFQCLMCRKEGFLLCGEYQLKYVCTKNIIYTISECSEGCCNVSCMYVCVCGCGCLAVSVVLLCVCNS